MEPRRAPGQSEARAEVSLVGADFVGENPGRLRDGVQHAGLSDAVVVVTQAGVKREVWGEPPFILDKSRKLVQVGIGGRPGGAGSGKCLGKRVARVGPRKTGRAGV